MACGDLPPENAFNHTVMNLPNGPDTDFMYSIFTKVKEECQLVDSSLFGAFLALALLLLMFEIYLVEFLISE